jgi:DNA polymerase III epsilon subunit-like protein
MAIGADRYWVIDVEGNGASPPEMIELAMIEVQDLRLTGRVHHWFIRPEQPIQPAVTRIHGITDADVANAPALEDIADDVMLWLDQASIVGHNVRIELDIISRSIPEWAPRAAIDTIALAKALQPGLKSYSLEKLGLELGLSQEATRRSGRGHHSAIFDANLAALIFIHFLSGAPEARRAGLLKAADILNSRQTSLL